MGSRSARLCCAGGHARGTFREVRGRGSLGILFGGMPRRMGDGGARSWQGWRATLWEQAERAAFTDSMSASGAFAAMALLWLVLPDPAVSAAWAILGVAVSEFFGMAGTAVLALTLARTLAV